MANQPDSSDDLIAELAKLMATNAKGDASGNKTSNAPASSTPSPALQGLAGGGAKPSVRIPGLDMPPLSVVPIDTTTKSDSKPSTFDFKPMAPMPSQSKPGTTVPVIRIPGMDQPVPAAPQPAPSPAPQPQVAAPAPKPVIPAVVSPVSTKPAPLVSAPEIKPVERTVPPVTPVRATTSTAPQKVEPQIVSPASPQMAPVIEAVKQALKDEPPANSNTSSGDKPKDQKPAFDPIAAIIAADQSETEAEKPATPVGKPTPVAATAPKPTTVTPVVPLNPKPQQQQKEAAKLSPAAPIALKPAFGAKPVAPENDKFFVAPVFGIGTKAGPPISSPPPAAEAKPVATSTRRPGDPMDEIETLIGEAVRVDAEAEKDKVPLDQPEPSKPVVPPLTTNFAPRRAGLKDDPDTAPQSAEAAILAAVAASGSDVGRIEPVVGEEPSRRKTKYKPKPARRQSGARQYVGLAVAGTLLLAAGLSLYWVLGMGRGDPANAPLLTADASPVKETPAVVASTEPRSPVLDEIDGVEPPAEGETLVSRDDTEGESPTEVAAVPEVTESGLANRKVRTVTVRPDGTIVESDDSVAGAEALPVERPDVPEVPGESIEPSEMLTAAAQGDVVDPIAAAISELIPATAPGAGEDVANAEPDALAGGEVDADDPLAVASAETDPAALTALAQMPEGATPTPPGTIAPTPQARPLNRERLNGHPTRSVTAAVDTNNGGLALTAGGQQIDLLAQPSPVAPEPTQVAVATPEPAGNDAAAYVQLSAQPSEDAARASARTLSNRFSSLFGGAEAEIHRVDLGTKGIWYRVLVPANSRASANSICLDIKNAGGDCILR